jgi:6-phosphogluconolactonase (cycloisomerase 2 family)
MTYIDTTPDGENLYAVSSRHVERLTIDTVTGIPTWIERVQPPSSSAGDKLTVSDDGKFLYWGDINANRVYVFSIDVSTGGLTHLQTFNNGDSGSLINGVTDLKISPDGLFLYIAATRDDYLTVFSRDILCGVINSDSVESENSLLTDFSVSHAQIHLGVSDTSRWLP